MMTSEAGTWVGAGEPGSACAASETIEATAQQAKIEAIFGI
jgi:hypothetical protein